MILSLACSSSILNINVGPTKMLKVNEVSGVFLGFSN